LVSNRAAKQPDGTLKDFKNFHDISTNDPEELMLYEGYRNSTFIIHILEKF
jgi:hypothetical protein